MDESGDLEMFISIINKHQVLEITSGAKSGDWEQVWKNFAQKFESGVFENETERHIFTDLFFHQCLSHICPARQSRELFTIVAMWYNRRKPQNRCGQLIQDERIALIRFVVTLRKYLLELLTNVPLQETSYLTEEQQRLLISLWRQVFFEPFFAAGLYWNPSKQEQEDVIQKCRTGGYGGLVAAGMFQPFNADDYCINADELLSADIPFCFKTIIIIWMVNTPYCHGMEKHRQKLLEYVPALCKALRSNPQIINTFFFFTFVQEVMTGFWRASYIGGNNLEALSAFGDFISLIIQKSFGFSRPQAVEKKLEEEKKIRIGYVSRNFYKQAVGCYMVNRVIHHSRDKFEVCIFALGEYHDEISELFKVNCDHFERFANPTDLRAIAQSIIDQKLDILIYSDIGMDPVTYILSGLQLAPVQCALAGHGTSTGMPNIQYYLSGDFETPDAQKHYREKLIKLPKLGAAQYLPMKPKKYLSRKQVGIPEGAVVFISCANGLKHGKARYSVFVDILAKAPNAWIILKPYAHASDIDYNFAGEILSLAGEAGVADRLKIMSPIDSASHVLGLLSIADVQLDSYPYGGWTTNMEALYMGLPIVTQEGEMARSRWGAGMLRALGIGEGIALSEEEYVNWAVKFAQDAGLRRALSKRIKRRVKKTLFNGPAAQPAYEKALIRMYQDSLKQPETVNVMSREPDSNQAVIVTSLAPGNLENQLQAMHTWRQAGFKVVSVNAIDEIAVLRPKAAGMDFVAVSRDARDKYGKPYVYFDDLVAYFKNRRIKICGIVNSDIYLVKPEAAEWIRKEIDNSLIFGSRIDKESLSGETGTEYERGFDYFFFDRKIADCYPVNQEFCMGLPWWDYWAVIVPLMHRYNVKRITSPIAVHLAHLTQWNLETWHCMGEALAKRFKPSSASGARTLAKYASEILAMIKSLSNEVTI